MSRQIEKVLLFDSDGTEDWVINPLQSTSLRCHYFPLDADSPPSVPIDTNSVSEYDPARHQRVNIAKYDYWGLSFAMKVEVAGVVGGGFWRSSGMQMFATGVVEGANKQQDDDLNTPYSQAATAGAIEGHFAYDRWYSLTNTGTGEGTTAVADGSTKWVSNFGFYTTTAGSMNTNDQMKLFCWLGPAGVGNNTGIGAQGIPLVTEYDEAVVSLDWYPDFSTLAPTTEPRIKMTIHGVGVIL